MPLAESSNFCNHLLILIVLRYSCRWQSCHCLLLCRNITLNFGMLYMEEICILCQVVPGCVQLPLIYQTHLSFVIELSGTEGILLAAAIWSISGQLGVAKARSLYISWWRPIQCSMFLALARTKFACIIIMTSRKTLGKYVQQPTF